MNPIDKEFQKTAKVFGWVGLILGVSGLALVAWFASVWVALGIFLMIWGNNLLTAVQITKALMMVIDHVTDSIIKERTRQ